MRGARIPTLTGQGLQVNLSGGPEAIIRHILSPTKQKIPFVHSRVVKSIVIVFLKCHRVLLTVVKTATVVIKGEEESHCIVKWHLPELLTIPFIRFGRAKMADKWLQK